MSAETTALQDQRRAAILGLTMGIVIGISGFGMVSAAITGRFPAKNEWRDVAEKWEDTANNWRKASDRFERVARDTLEDLRACVRKGEGPSI